METIFQITVNSPYDEVEIPDPKDGQILTAKGITRTGRTYTTTCKADGKYWLHLFQKDDASGTVLCVSKLWFSSKNLVRELLDILRYKKMKGCPDNIQSVEITITKTQGEKL